LVAKGFWSFVVALLALGVQVGGAAAAHLREEVGLYEAVGVVPAGGLLALVAISLARRARFEHQRTVRRSAGRVFAALGLFLGIVALLTAITAALALVVFAVLTFALD
jgi:hypothetical protein